LREYHIAAEKKKKFAMMNGSDKEKALRLSSKIPTQFF